MVLKVFSYLLMENLERWKEWKKERNLLWDIIRSDAVQTLSQHLAIVVELGQKKNITFNWWMLSSWIIQITPATYWVQTLQSPSLSDKKIFSIKYKQ